MPLKKILIITTFCLLVILAVGMKVPEIFDFTRLLNFTKGKPYLGPLVFGCVYAILVVCLLPTAPLNLLAGYIWGPWWGCLLVVISVTAGSTVSFFIARSIFYEFVSKLVGSSKYAFLSRILEGDAWKIMIMIRMNPIFPTGPINYLIGSSKVSFMQFVLPTFVCLAPPSFALAYAGFTLQELVIKEFNPFEILWPIILASSLITAVVLVSMYFKSKIAQKL
jgi:uncharacterized membrane protein YdjX (TVP38/TMEM64 family)